MEKFYVVVNAGLGIVSLSAKGGKVKFVNKDEAYEYMIQLTNETNSAYSDFYVMESIENVPNDYRFSETEKSC
jgi:hypothetical protein